jgi:hypothetical protein
MVLCKHDYKMFFKKKKRKEKIMSISFNTVSFKGNSQFRQRNSANLHSQPSGNTVSFCKLSRSARRLLNLLPRNEFDALYLPNIATPGRFNLTRLHQALDELLRIPSIANRIQRKEGTDWGTVLKWHIPTTEGRLP